jgi:hypothetical protein
MGMKPRKKPEFTWDVIQLDLMGDRQLEDLAEAVLTEIQRRRASAYSVWLRLRPRDAKRMLEGEVSAHAAYIARRAYHALDGEDDDE